MPASPPEKCEVDAAPRLHGRGRFVGRGGERRCRLQGAGVSWWKGLRGFIALAMDVAALLIDVVFGAAAGVRPVAASSTEIASSCQQAAGLVLGTCARYPAMVELPACFGHGYLRVPHLDLTWWAPSYLSEQSDNGVYWDVRVSGSKKPGGADDLADAGLSARAG